MDALLRRRPPTTLERFLENPLLFLARILYLPGTERPPQLDLGKGTPICVVCISDTHSHHSELSSLPEGDILVHAGDLTHSGTPEELRSALQWLSDQPFAHKIFIAGNHDHALTDESLAREELLIAFPDLVYLQESSVEISVRGRTLHIYGSPLTPKHGSWPFQYPRHEPQQANWSAVPAQTDILITHGPPAHHLDNGLGCTNLLAAVWRVRPALHVCGHIHAARGVEHLYWSRAQAAYERICMRAGGWWDLLLIVLGRWTIEGATTTLVNAASLGGFRDDERRGALCVTI
jgi:Icc-related predicted phosphoesterase